jgi:hypothetical protein
LVKFNPSPTAQMNSREEIQQSFEDYQLGCTGGLTP